MSNKVWRTMWQNNNIAFHQLKANPLLELCLPQLGLTQGAKILVPMCGKSLDMVLLADNGHHIMGVELSSIAISDYFEALGVNPSRKKAGSFTRWRHKNTEIWCGDIFELSAKDLSDKLVVYDCASLTALPAASRPNYVQHFYDRLPSNSQIILAATESPDARKANSAQTIDSEVSSLYGNRYNIELIHGRTCVKQDPEQPNAPHQPMEEKIYRLIRR